MKTYTDTEDERCDQCDAVTNNTYSACAGACAEERSQGVILEVTGTNMLPTCNCCDACRDNCHNSWIEDNIDNQ